MQAFSAGFAYVMSREHSEVVVPAAAGCDVYRLARPASILSSLPMEAIRRYIRMNLAGRIRVSDIASIAGVDALRFARALRRQFQITPYALVVAMRIEVAEQLLRSGMSIADAAFSAGFCDQSHLTRHLKRRLGTTPSKIRPPAKVART
jgi:AraC family transcriptional regulator